MGVRWFAWLLSFKEFEKLDQKIHSSEDKIVYLEKKLLVYSNSLIESELFDAKQE